MAQIPQLPDRSRLRGIPNTGSVPRVTPDDFGARQFNDVYRLSGAVANAGQEQMAWARRNAESQARADFSSMYMKEQEESRTRMLQTTGEASFDSVKMMEESSRKSAEAAHKRLKNPLARAVFDGMRQDFDRQNLVRADEHVVKQRAAYELTSRQAYKDGLITEGAMDGGNNFAGNIQKIKAENEMIHAGQPREFIDQENEKDAMLAVMARAQYLGSTDPAAALEFLNSGVEVELGNGAVKKEFLALREKYGKEMISDAKKKAENDMRQIGINLGDQFDTEYEIIDALRGIDDRDLARIAREEAETVRKARLAMGKEKPMTTEEKARDDRVSRDLAATIIKGTDQESPDDDIMDEDELDAALDTALSRATETRREKVRKYAMTQLKAKRAQQARDRKAMDQKAMETMAAAGWDIAAIDPSWPLDLQDKMEERALKRADAADRREDRLEKAARKAQALELLEMPLDQLNERILKGEWLDIVDGIGIGTPEYNKLVKRLTGEESSDLTMLQYAKNRYTEIIGNPLEKKKDFAKFNLAVSEARTGKAKSLKIDNPDMIPADEQRKIIDSLLVKGDRGGWTWLDNEYRYQVTKENLSNWQPFEDAATADLPDFAQPYLGPRDLRRETLPNGSVLIESSNGKVTIVNPDGSLIEGTP